MLTACGDDKKSGGDAANGKRLFSALGCKGCHTFAAAGSHGTVGPDLDVAGPSRATVVNVLKRPRGVMPDFSKKVSVQEREDLAAFVAAKGGKKDTVSAAFKPDNRSLDTCAKTDFLCVEQAFGNLTYKEGPKVALAELQSRIESDPGVLQQCHRISHLMGGAGLLRYRGSVAQAFVQGSAVCASGYYHGILERAFAMRPNEPMSRIAKELCVDRAISGQPFVRFQCLHGLGHGLMINSGYDMPGSLKVCEALADDFEQSSCSGGVFMENFNTSYGTTSKYVRTSDPIYPCNSVAERHKYQCYGMVTANILRITSYDNAQTAHSCLRSERDWVRICFESFGRDMSGIYKDAGKLRGACRLAKSHESDCLYGAAREIVNADAGSKRAARFCRSVRRGHRAHCFEGMGSVLHSLKSGDALRDECRAAAGPSYAAACRLGAGLA
ncbi:MAG TPA: cytochrome c [Solirubrobacteraceae bacterium]